MAYSISNQVITPGVETRNAFQTKPITREMAKDEQLYPPNSNKFDILDAPGQ